MRNIVFDKSFSFSVHIVKLYRHICTAKQEYTLSKQLLRSGTSIGANIAEAQQAQSKADFISKLSIALKETTETKYWIRLLHATDYITDTQLQPIMAECVELEKPLVSILKTAKQQ